MGAGLEVGSFSRFFGAHKADMQHTRAFCVNKESTANLAIEGLLKK